MCFLSRYTRVIGRDKPSIAPVCPWVLYVASTPKCVYSASDWLDSEWLILFLCSILSSYSSLQPASPSENDPSRNQVFITLPVIWSQMLMKFSQIWWWQHKYLFNICLGRFSIPYSLMLICTYIKMQLYNE